MRTLQKHRLDPRRWLACLILGLGIGADMCAGAAGATVIEKRAAASADDAEEYSSNGMTHISSNSLELIHDTSDQVVGMRWTGLTIPPGATITAAYIQFAAKESQSEVTSLTLRAQAADNATAFNNGKLNISLRPRTTASASWSPVPWTVGQVTAAQRTPDLSAVLQEVVKRPGWTSGNGLVVIVTGSGHRTAWSYDGIASLAPLLHVEYSTPPPDNPPVASLSLTTLKNPPFTVRADGSGSTDADLTPIASYRFDFGDTVVTTTAPNAVAQRTYATAGTRTVTLRVTDTASLTSAPVSDTITVRGPQADLPPVASLSVAQLASPALTVRADGSASTDTDLTPIASYRFDFGDTVVTTTAPTVTATHTYAAAGPHTVTLIATDTRGLSSAPASASLTVNPPAPPANQAPNGTINSPTSNIAVTAGQSVNFQGTGGDPDNNLPLAYFWDFGGGASNRTVEDPGAVVFSTAGTYTVRFVVTDALGLADPTPDTRVITVGSTPLSAADEIHWTFIDRTAVTFDWRGGSDSLRYGPTAAYGQLVRAVVPDPLPWSSAGPFREARLTGLTANTVYHYAIGSGADRTFRTPPPRGGSGFLVVAEGDIGSSSRMVTIQSEIAAKAPDFVLALGDLTYANNSGQAAVDAHFNAMMAWSRQAAYMPAWGNHDWDLGDDLRNYKGRFDLPNPQASPGAPLAGCCGEDWSWFDYGNARFISYPEPYGSSVRTDWQTHVAPIMDQAQADTSIHFIVTFGHRPPFSSGNHSSDTQWQTIMAALAANHPKYVLNLSGHSHDYERSYPQSGVVHITAGTGGQNLEATSDSSCRWGGGCPPPAWSAFRAMHHVVLTLQFTGKTIQGIAYCGPADPTRNDIACVDGTVLDAFTIQAPVVITKERTARPLSPLPPQTFLLSPNHPNPFSTTTDFQYSLPVPARVEMTLYSVLGKQVRVLVDGVQTAGVHGVEVDGRALEPAIYFVRFRATGTSDPAQRYTETRKILVLR